METLQLPRIFRDHCVLQQNKPCKIWGKAAPFARVEVQIQGREVSAKADGAGAWVAVLPELTGAGDETLVVRSLGEQVVVRHVGVGEVWLLGGQSNMEFYMRYDKEYPNEAAKSHWDDIRFFDVPEVSYPGQERDFDYTRFGKWRRAAAQDLEYCSAVGYYFAVQLAQKQSVPVGLVGCNWGGTIARTWMEPARCLRAGEVWQEEYEQLLHERHLGLDGEYFLHPEWNAQAGACEREMRAQYEQAYRKHPVVDRGNPFGEPEAVRLMYGMTRQEQETLMHSWGTPQEGDVASFVGPLHANRPGALYETMLKQVAPYCVRGVLWYQGESDQQHPEVYREMLTAVIESWRELWQECLPFFCVQLAPFGCWLQCEGVRFPQIRAAQMAVSEGVEQVYLASSSDVGERYDIHPKQKRPIGERLALLALRYVYGHDIEAESPRYSGHVWDGTTCRLSFAHAYGALRAIGEAGREFAVYRGTQEAAVPSAEYDVRIDADQVVITFHTPQTQACRIAYAWTDYYEVNLYNHAELPLFPFEAVLAAAQ